MQVIDNYRSTGGCNWFKEWAPQLERECIFFEQCLGEGEGTPAKERVHPEFVPRVVELCVPGMGHPSRWESTLVPHGTC